MALRGYYKLAEGLQFLADPEEIVGLEFRGVQSKDRRYGDDGTLLAQPVQDHDANGNPKWQMKTSIIKEKDGSEVDDGELIWTITGEKPNFRRGAMIQPVSPLIGIWPQNSGSAAYTSLTASDWEEIEL